MEKMTIKQLEKRVNSLSEELSSLKFEVGDTSVKSGRSFKTIEPNTKGLVVIDSYYRTKYLRNYICVKAEHEGLVLELNNLKSILLEKQKAKAKRNINKLIKEAVVFGVYSKDNPNGQFFSAGVYRVAFDKYGKVIASVLGGYHDSCPQFVDRHEWAMKLSKYLTTLSNVEVVLKADGSCGDLFLRESYNFENIKVYDVPKMGGGVHTNIQVVF